MKDQLVKNRGWQMEKGTFKKNIFLFSFDFGQGSELEKKNGFSDWVWFFSDLGSGLDFGFFLFTG